MKAEVTSAPGSRYWKARQRFIESGVMEKHLSFVEVLRVGRKLISGRFTALRLYGMSP